MLFTGFNYAVISNYMTIIIVKINMLI